MKKFLLIVLLLPLAAFAQNRGDEEFSITAGQSLGMDYYDGSGLGFGYSHSWLNHTDWMLTLSQFHGNLSFWDGKPEGIAFANATRTALSFGCKGHWEFASLFSAGAFVQLGLLAETRRVTRVFPDAVDTSTYTYDDNVVLFCRPFFSPVLKGGVFCDVFVTDALTLGLTADCSLPMAFFKEFNGDYLSMTAGVKIGWHF